MREGCHAKQIFELSGVAQLLNGADRTGPYPGIAAALKAGRDWLSGGTASNHRRLLVNGNVVNGNLAAGAGETFGI